MDQMTAIVLSKWKRKSDYQSSEVRKKRRNQNVFFGVVEKGQNER